MRRMLSILTGIFLLASLSVSRAAPAGAAESDGAAVRFSRDSCVAGTDELRLVLEVPDGYTIAYTTDGRFPGPEDDCGSSRAELVLKKEEEGLLLAHREQMVFPEIGGSAIRKDPALAGGRVVRACAVSPSGVFGEPQTRTYFLGKDFYERFPGCLIVSCVADPDDLLDEKRGILVTGARYKAWRPTDEAASAVAEGRTWDYQANFTQQGRAWERPCRIQIFDGGDAPALEAGAGMRITGHAARSLAQKSFNFYFRSEYGDKYLRYPLFGGTGRFRSFRMRSGGNDGEGLKFKDAFLLELVSGRSFTSLRSRPAVLFLNGEYWGPYLLSEKISDFMLAEAYGLDKDEIIVIKEGELEDGKEEDLALYRELEAYAERDLSDPGTWDAFCDTINVRSFAELAAARIYFGDADWSPEKNSVLWRTRDGSYDGGRWQCVLYDVEFSCGLYGARETAPETDHFRVAIEKVPLFAAAVRNPAFFEMFRDALYEIGSVDCVPERVRSLMQTYVSVWEPLMPDFYRRFGNHRTVWNVTASSALSFFNRRFGHILPFVDQYPGGSP